MGDYEGIARRAWRRTVPIAIIGFVVGAVVGIIVSSGDDVLARVLAILGVGMSFGGLGGALSLAPASFRLAPSMQWPIRELDKSGRKAVRRAVFSGRPLGEPGSEMAHRAFDWARGAAVTLPVMIGQFLLLYAGIAGSQLPNLERDDLWLGGFARMFIAVIVVVGIAVSISLGRQIRGARRYLEAVSAR
ncbi:hypothetical protein Csp2054_09330 [Curtobacterium sp. 'Ferrero']|uniref:hypothetical protein n=1 Tax=Curtobacterium sp. 'Ferrero' TaxID=2033654 RepID=UPI000BC9C491|nr:hypothetical protein [Curtobacterium sp. 'Ferrero']PCN48064.1 hypothetical protein Csp2054_09330 [Curtobacterium sp. 'Ferrero']